MTPDRHATLDQVEEPVGVEQREPEPRPVGRNVVELVRTHGVVGVLYALAAVPVISMVIEVIRSPLLQFYDFWFVLERVANPDGSLHPRGIFTYRNEHPTFIPGFIYWLDAKFLKGLNPPLGLLSVVMAAATVVLLTWLLPRRISGVTRAALAATFAFLLLSPQGLHNFVMGMSGTSWLLANLMAVSALLAIRSNRGFLAIGFALIACLSYGTGFALWPAIAVAHWLRRDRWWRVVVPIAIGLAIIGVWALTLDRLNPGPETDAGGLEEIVASLSGTAGSLWGPVAPIAGLTTIMILVIFLIIEARRRLAVPRTPMPAGPIRNDAALWVALGVYALGGIAEIALARADEGLDALLTSRYTSMPALALCALLGLGAIYLRRPRPAVTVAVLLGISLLTYGMSASRAQTVRDNFPKQSAIAVAMHVNAVHAIVPDEFPLVAVDTARNMGAYPFTDDYTIGCGGPELGDQVDVEGAMTLPPAPGVDGNRGTIDRARNLPDKNGQPTGWYFNGWALINNHRADCVLVVDTNGVIVGGGAVDVRRRDVVSELIVDEAHSGFIAVASPTVQDPVVLVSSGGQLYKVDSGH